MRQMLALKDRTPAKGPQYLRSIMEEVVLEVWVRGFEPHERAYRQRWIMQRRHAMDRVQILTVNPDIALVSHKIYRLVEEK